MRRKPAFKTRSMKATSALVHTKYSFLPNRESFSKIIQRVNQT